MIYGNESIIRAYGVSFRVTDSYNRKIKFGLMTDIASNNGQEEATLPIPATYIIDRDGSIIARQFDPDYKNRASVKWILDHLPPRYHE